MPDLMLNTTSTAQWQSLVAEAGRCAERELAVDHESYLVFTLMRFTSKPELGDALFAIDYLRSLEAAGRGRHDRLRDVGDGCLLYSGLFPKQARHRLVPISYFVNLGRSAYDNLGTNLPDAYGALYLGLSADFVALMDVLLAMRKLAAGTSCLDAIDAVELWTETGSTHAKSVCDRLTDACPVTHDVDVLH